jgi:polyisoprenoid-binding protein YceI
MTKFFLSILFAAGFSVATYAGNPENGKTKINLADSKVEWTAHKVTGKHSGTINIKEGTLDIKDDMLVGGSFVIDMTSIAVTDLSGEYKGKLEGHLKGDDFFAVATHPTASMKITQATPKGEGQYQVKGDLTVKGITKPVTFMADFTPEGKKYRAVANIKIDRTLYDVKYGSNKFFEDLGDSAIYDEFDLTVVLVTQ